LTYLPKQLERLPMASSTIATILASPLGGVVSDIREWLEREKIEPVHFQAVVNARGLGFEISFENDHDAVRFQQRFSSFGLVAA
jgi:hypothetical protein